MTTPTYKFEVFEGPLDLLLNLIEKHKIDIYDIEISLLTEQYIIYIEQAKERDWNLTADFIEMAARLMYIKSASLLPPPFDEEEEDSKADLELLLQEYARYKRISSLLRDDYIGSQIFFREVIPTNLPKPPANYNYNAERLELAFKRVMAAFGARGITSQNFSGIIGKQIISVNSKILYVLKKARREKSVVFENFFCECRSRSEIVATFLAILELIRAGRFETKEKDDKIELILISNK